MSQNETLAKLWIEKLMLLNASMMYSGERSIQVIDEILNNSVYDCIKKLHSQINLMHFNATLNKDGQLVPKNVLSISEYRANGLEAVKNNKEELHKAFTKTISEEQIIKFVQENVTRLINKEK